MLLFQLSGFLNQQVKLPIPFPQRQFSMLTYLICLMSLISEFMIIDKIENINIMIL